MNKIVIGAKNAGETISQVFDFASRLGVGETISNASTTAVVYSGLDATPSALISGSSTVSGTQVTQKLTAGTLGVTYLITCTASTSTSQILQLAGYLVIV